MYNAIVKILQIKIVQYFFLKVCNFENTEISASLRQVTWAQYFVIYNYEIHLDFVSTLAHTRIYNNTCTFLVLFDLQS